MFDWIDQLRSSSYYVEFDLDNLEHVFSLAEMSRQIGLPEGEPRFTDMRLLVMETLDACQELRWSSQQIVPDETYDAFVKRIVYLNADRRKRVRPEAESEDDVIISFNYDVMLDHAMYHNRIERDYRLEGTQDHGFRLLKLHGSTNWGSCADCGKNTLQPVNPTPLQPGYAPIVTLEDGQRIDFKMATELLATAPCWHCQKKETLEPYVIPPTWSKDIRDTPLAPVWAAAVEAIKTAFQIIVIGYSMPPTDTFFQYLLTLSLSSNRGLHRVGVVNPSIDEGLRDRYEKVFSRSLKDRGHLRFRECNFQNFVQQQMDELCNSVAWPVDWK